MERPFLIGSWTEGERRRRDWHLTQRRNDHSEREYNVDELLPKNSEPIYHYHFAEYLFSVDFYYFGLYHWLNQLLNRKWFLLEKKQQIRLLSQLSESDANFIDFMIRQNNHEAQSDSLANSADANITSNNTKESKQINSSQVDILKNKLIVHK